MKEFSNDAPSTSSDAGMQNGVQDPSSISLFSTELGGENTRGAPSPVAFSQTADQSALNSSDDNVLTGSNKKGLETSKREGDKQGKIQQNYTSYVAGKATEVAKRRNLNERIGRLQSKHGILFNVPQCQNITLNQLAIFLRRLRKSTDVRALMSSELMLKIFQEDAEIQPKVASQQSQTQNQHHPAVISVNEVLGSDDETRQRDDEDEATEASSESDMELDSERPTTSRTGEQSGYDPFRFYKERMEILAADARALALHRRLSDTQQKVRQAYATLPQDFLFGAMPIAGNTPEEDPTITCARCRPLINRPNRELTYFNLAGKRIRKPRMMTSNIVCNVMEYSAVDDSIHSSLSLSSAIPMERKVHKYLQVVGTLPAEVERRRLKTAQLAYRKEDKVLRSFRYTEEQNLTEEVVEEEPSAISLKIKKKITKPSKVERAESPLDEEWQSTDDGMLDTDTESNEYPIVPKPRKRKESTYAHKKAIPSESRRPSVHAASNHDFGVSVFDYDPSFMDIGLTAVQNVDQPEIAIPLFRKKDLLDQCLKRPCETCSCTEDYWADLRKMHTELEIQERQRFKGIINSRTRP